MSNVVMMNLLKARQAGPFWKAFHLHPRKWMVASTAIFLFGWDGGVFARIPPVPAVGGRPWMASGANRSASRDRTSLNWHGLANSKISPAVRPVNSTLVCSKPARGAIAAMHESGNGPTEKS
jgi:hypothetical protein